jgi:hypothetical protein
MFTGFVSYSSKANPLSSTKLMASIRASLLEVVGMF